MVLLSVINLNVLVHVMLVMLMTVLMMIAVQSTGLVMVLKTVKIKHLAVT